MATITHLKEFQEPALRGFVDESVKAPMEELNFVNEFIGDEVTYSTTYAYDVVQQSQFIAGMIGLGAEKPVVDRHATAKVMGELAHFGLKDVVTIEELYEIAQARNSDAKAAMVDKLLNKSADLVDALKLRIRVEKMKALALGYNDYNKNGVKINLDYGIPAEHKIALTGVEAWSDVNKDVIGDLLSWSETYRQTNGKKPEAMLVTRPVINALTANLMVIAEAGRPDGAVRVSQAEVQEVLTRYGLPQLRVVEETEVAVKNQETNEQEIIEVFPANRIVFVSKGAGKFLTGPNPDASNFAPVTTLEAYDERTPKRSVIEVAQSGFAVLENPNLVMHVDVLEG